MSGEKKSNRKFRKLKMESLEKRELMAANVTASVSGGTLFINGTQGADGVVVELVAQQTRVRANGRVILQVPTTSYSSLNADMGDGNDVLNVYLANNRTLNRVDVNMGRGSSETLLMELGYARTVNVNADISVRTTVTLSDSSVDSVMVNFGNDGGNDSLRVINSSVNQRLQSNLGGGNDLFYMSRSAIERAEVDLGSGDDTFQISTTNSQVRRGFVDGGSGRDRYWNFGGNSPGQVSIRNFEW